MVCQVQESQLGNCCSSSKSHLCCISFVWPHNMSSEPKNVDDWERYVRPNFEELVRKLKPSSSLLDSLYNCGLLTQEEYNSLRLPSYTDENRSRDLLAKILPRKENDAFIKFCRVLTSKGQEHLVTEVMKIPSTHPARAPVQQIEHPQLEKPSLQPESKQQVRMRVSNLLF